MTTAIQFLRSNVPGLRPNPLTLSDGMPMVNFHLNDPGLYFKSTDNTLLKIGPTHYSANPPNFNGPGFDQLCKGEMWLDTSAPDPQTPRAVLKVWSGSAWVAAGGAILQEEQPQAKNTFLGGPLSGPDAVPTFRLIDNLDIPDDLDYHKFAGGDVEGGLLIGGGVNGWEVDTLTMGPGMTQTVGPNMITLEVTAGDIAADGSPGVNFHQGDGHVQLNYGGKFTGDARFKLINKDVPAEDKVIAHLSTELGQDPLTHTHIIKGDTTLSGDLTLTDVYSIDAGGDLTIGHNVTFGASPADLFQVYCTSTFYEDVTIDGLNDLTVGGNIIGINDTLLGTGDTNTHTLAGTTNLNGPTNIGRDCGDAISVKGTTTFDCDTTFNGDLVIGVDLTVEGNILLGTDCTNTLGVQAKQYNKCDILIGSNLPAANAELIKFDATTGLGKFKNDVEIDNDLFIGNANPGFNIVVDGSEGDIDASGTITASYFVGDGSQLFNLAIPNAMLFHGDIDATSSAAPANPVAGDFYLNNTTGTVTAAWPNIGGQPINQDQFIYFYDDGASGRWALGSVQNQQGFVTINTNQNINGTKTFTVDQIFNEKIFVYNDALLDAKLTVNGAALFNHSLTVNTNKPTDLRGTLTVANHTQLNDTLTVADGKLTTLGGDLISKHNCTLGTNCTDIIQINGSAKFGCGLTIGDPANPCVADPFKVYSLSDFYCPVRVHNTLTVDNFATTLGGTLTVTGATVLNSTLTVANGQSTTLGGTLTVKQATTLQNTLTVTGHTQLNNTLTVANGKATTLGGTLTVKQATVLQTTLEVIGTTTLQNTLTVAGHTQLNSSLTVADGKNTVLGGQLTVKQASTLNGTLTVAGHTQLNNTLTVANGKATILGGTLTVKQATTLQNTLTVSGATTLNSTLSVASNASVGGTLGVSGATTLSSTLTVGGHTQLNNTLTVADGKNTVLGSQLTVKGNGIFNSKVQIKSNAGDALSITGKARSAATVDADAGSTLVTKDYLIGKTNAAGKGTLTAQQTGGNNSDPNLRLQCPGETTNVQIAGGGGVSVTRNSNNKITISATTPAANNGQINFNAGNGLASTGNNATANQSGNTTKTFTVKAANNTISVSSAGIAVNTGNLPAPSTPNLQAVTNVGATTTHSLTVGGIRIDLLPTIP